MSLLNWRPLCMKSTDELAATPAVTLANPLLDAEGLRSLRTWITNREALVQGLRYQPFEGMDVKAVPVAEKLLALPRLRHAFVPSPDAVQVAERMLHLIYFELERRNPMAPQNQRWVNMTSQWLGGSVERIPWQPVQAQGMVIEGLTGIGKSHVVERALSLLPQVVEHFPQGQWGMQYLKHLVWLRVPMPADHSRLGFLAGLLRGMDEALGTSYAIKHAGPNARVERLIVVVMHLLVQHRCGMLVIEEAQEQNLAAFSRVFLNFFLRILNWGIPVVLVGNPMAFDLIKTHAQDTDRFSEGGWLTLNPPLGPNTAVWQRIWIPGIWGATLLAGGQEEFEPLPAYPGIADWPAFLWQLTGGLPRQLCRLRMEVLEAALRRNRVSINSRFVEEVFRYSPRFAMVRDRNAALANRDIKALMQFQDLPVAQLSRYWAAASVREAPDPQVAPPAAPPLAGTALGMPRKDCANPDEKGRLCRDLQAATEGQVAKPPRRSSTARGPD